MSSHTRGLSRELMMLRFSKLTIQSNELTRSADGRNVFAVQFGHQGEDEEVLEATRNTPQRPHPQTFPAQGQQISFFLATVR